MKVQNVISANQGIRTGDLYGNRFSIAIRLMQFTEDDIHRNISDLKQFGFINYYGM